MEAQAPSQLLAFHVMGHHFVVDVRRVFELLRAGEAVAVPGSHPALLGLLLWRSRSVPLLSLERLLFGSTVEGPEARRRRTIVLEAQSQLFALEVDGVDEVLQVRPSDVLDDAQAPTAGLSRFVLGSCQVEGRRYLLLDVRPLLALVAAPPAAPLALVSGRSP